MECFEIKNLTFTYPNRDGKALDGISITVKQGEFITLCGKSGCGKTTLLRLLKSSLSPAGDLSGTISFQGKCLSEVDAREQAGKIGFVMQSPDAQIVTDKVWHELAFGLESLGYATPEIRTRVSEMASFFGIQTWFHKKVTDLSGGQKQLLNLASVMVMQPSVLILDEPTSQLDPIAAQEFLKTLEKINRELGVAVILAEHRLEDAVPVSDRILVMDHGRIIADAPPKKIGGALKNLHHEMYAALPTPIRVCGTVDDTADAPLTVRDGRVWLEAYAEKHPLKPALIPKPPAQTACKETAIEITDAWFRYEKDSPDVIKGLHVQIHKGEVFAILGGNAAGKTTILSLISGLLTPYRGEILINGRPLSTIPNLYHGVLGSLPQDPRTVFIKKTVYLDLWDMLSGQGLSKEERELRIKNIVALCRIDGLLARHPYDLSGGEQQRAALAKVLLKNPEILLLDEPTKGMDAPFKQIFAEILSDLKSRGVTIVMVSHDIEFCAEHADRCALVFDGTFTSTEPPRDFFAGKNFYTTSANRMARNLLPAAVLAEDIVLACGGMIEKREEKKGSALPALHTLQASEVKKEPVKKITPSRLILGTVFALLFLITCIKPPPLPTVTQQILSILELFVCLLCFLPQRTFSFASTQPKQRLTKRTILATLLILFAIPLTIYIGIYHLHDKRYYFISLLMIVEIMIPFAVVFEGRKPQARELIIISVLCALATAGRTVFFMLPQFKPALALVIIAGVCFGGETGFLVGAITGFVSNFFFGQGPWTPWQMFALGIVGLIGGILFQTGVLRRTKASLSVFGFLATILLYGGILNPSFLFMSQAAITKELLLSSYVAGFPFDLVHATSTALFLWFLSEEMIDKIERLKVKYGLIER